MPFHYDFWHDPKCDTNNFIQFWLSQVLTRAGEKKKKNLVILDKQPSGDIIKSVAGRRAKIGGKRWNTRICASTLMCVCADPLFADIFLFRRSDQSQKKTNNRRKQAAFLCVCVQQRGESVFDRRKCFMAMPRFTSACVFQVSKLCLF